MENDNIYKILKEVLGESFIEEAPDELKFIDKYYIDKERRKYVLICKVFSDDQELNDKWEVYQDEDIALRLQNEIFKNDDIRWDMYYLLIYKGHEEIDDLRCYEIERNRFCCKKLIFNAKSEVLFKRDLRYKLPITTIYSSFSEDVDVANDDYFFEIINKKCNIDAKKVLKILKYNN